MIEHYQGNIFETLSSVIGHGCNCQGVMGAGIAKQIKIRFPKAFVSYKKACENKTFNPSMIQVVSCKDKFIANLATQKFYGRKEAFKYAKLNDVKICLSKLIQWCCDNNINRFAIPKIGCGLAGLNWAKDVYPMIQDLSNTHKNITIEIWSL